MKKIMVSLAVLMVLAIVVPQVEAGQRHRQNHRGHAISSGHGSHRTGIRHGHGYQRAYAYPYYGHGHHRRAYYGGPYYAPYYGYGPYGYGYGFPGIALSIGGGHHFGGHFGGHHGGHH